MVLQGRICTLRSVESKDIDTILLWENDSEVRRAGSPEKEMFTRADIEQFVRNQQHPTAETGQLRVMIDVGRRTVGAIDLYEHNGISAGVGILVYAASDRRNGYAADALQTLIGYARETSLALLYAETSPSNVASRRLFERSGFVCTYESSDKIGLTLIL